MNGFFDFSSLRKGYFRVFLFLFFFSPALFAQNGGNTCAFVEIMATNRAIDDIVSVEVRLKGAGNISSAQFAVEWPKDAAEIVGINSAGSHLSQLSIGSNFNYNLAVSTGQLLFSWTDFSAHGNTLPNDALLFTIRLLVKPNAPAFIPVNISTGNGTVPLELTDANLSVLPRNSLNGGIYLNGSGSSLPVVSNICPDQILCNSSVGDIDLTVGQGQPPYLFEWERDSAFSAQTEDLSDLSPGLYLFTVTDQSGATKTGSAEIKTAYAYVQIQPYYTLPSPVGAGDGEVSVGVYGMVPPYSYQWDPPLGTGNTLTNVAAGTYAVTVTDANNCTETRQLVLENPVNPTMVVDAQVVQPRCNPNQDGSISISVIDGQPPISFLWNDGDTSATRSGLSPGIYAFTVTDALGVAETQVVTLSDLGTDHWVLQADVICAPALGSSLLTSSVAVDPVYPAPTYPVTIDWSNGVQQWLGSAQSMDSVVNMADGVFDAIVTDALGCQKAFDYALEVQCAAQFAYQDEVCAMLRIGHATAQPGDTIVLPVFAKGYFSMNHMELNMDFDTAQLTFIGVEKNGLFQSNVGGGTDTIDHHGYVFWHGSNLGQPLTVEAEQVLFSLQFVVKAAAQATETAVGLYGYMHLFSEKIVSIGTNCSNGVIAIGNPPSSGLELAICHTQPKCVADGLSDVDLQITGGQAPYSVAWDDLDLGTHYQGGSDGLKGLYPSTYRLTVTDQLGAKASAMVYVEPFVYPEFCMWPGDADDNRACNHFDLLYIGYGYGKSGASRTDTAMDWRGRELGYFNFGILSTFINYGNFDSNGDGTIWAPDTAAIVQNWGQVVRPGIDDPLAMPVYAVAPTDTTGLAFYPHNTSNTPPNPGDWVEVAYYLGTAAHPVADIGGIGFSIEYSPAVFDANTVRFFPAPDAWLGNAATDILHLQKNFADEGRLDVAVSRKGTFASGFGKIGVLRAKIRENLFLSKPLDNEMLHLTDTTILADLRLSHVFALGAGETRVPAIGMDTVLTIIKEIVIGTADVAGDLPVTVSPNPATAETTIFSPAAGICLVRLMDNSGRVVRELHFPSVNNCEIPTGDLPAGLYLLQIETEKGMVWRKLGKM